MKKRINKNISPEKDYDEGLPTPDHLGEPDEESELRHYIGKPEFKDNGRKGKASYYRRKVYNKRRKV